MYVNIIFGFNFNIYKKEIIQSAYLSKICYLNNNNNNIIKQYKQLNEFNKSFYITDKTNNNLSIIAYNKNKINIAFRGTHNKNNLISNLYASQESFINNSIKVHSGYLKTYLSFRDKIIILINNIIKYNNIDILIISGHSLGGCIASLCSVDLVNYYKNKYDIRCYTFGSPKIGNNNFVIYYNSKVKYSFRFVNNYDIFCLYPPLPIYKHVGKVIKLSNINNNFNFIKYHHMDVYIKNIQNKN